jgi:NAD(P)-dependent dehydrogenase (short-subunit alcohol dehydrogenase family)
MTGLLDGRVVIVTGAGRGIGREEALECARHGARVVVNDLGVARDSSERRPGPAEGVVAEIVELGGDAVANTDDVSDWDGARAVVNCAVESFGDLHVLVNNAGILRDRMLVNMSIEEWDDVIRVHLRGTFAPTRHALDYWRAQAKAGRPADARIINTTSPSGLYGSVGQANYGAAKAALAALTIIAADEVQRYGVTVNAIAPAALTRMTEGLTHYVEEVRAAQEATGFNPGDPRNVAPLVAWLASASSGAVTGRVFNIRGGHVSVAQTWETGPAAERDEGRWEVDELEQIIPELLAEARPNSDPWGRPRTP